MFSIGYGGNGEAYMTPTRTLFDRFTLFVYDPFVSQNATKCHKQSFSGHLFMLFQMVYSVLLTRRTNQTLGSNAYKSVQVILATSTDAGHRVKFLKTFEFGAQRGEGYRGESALLCSQFQTQF